jgi:ribosomal protein S18 acetylase RimI-like enzyme
VPVKYTTSKKKPRGLERLRKPAWEKLHREFFGKEYEKFSWPDEELFIEARDGSELVGFVWTWIDGGVCVIDELLVKEGRRGSGIGQKLLAKLETELKKRGVHKISLETYPGLEPANRFYDAAGFTLEATLPRHYGKRPAIVLGKRLD